MCRPVNLIVDVPFPQLPPPYRAVLAICSDLDETPDAETYIEQLRFLNTTEETSMGQGVGLEIGNTIYFDMPPGHFSYWNASEAEREKLRELIRSGHIDCIHSFGDNATSRAHAGRALEELEKHGCRIKVWVDHAVAPTNFGTDIMQGHGDDPQHEAYHADLTFGYGVRYVWRGRVTSVIGQHRRASYRGIWNGQYPGRSANTLLRECAKQTLARVGNRKYRLHRGNRLFQPTELRDGRKTIEFLRCNPHWGGVSCGDTGYGIADVLRAPFLDRLVKRRGACILYTHLGKLSKAEPRRFDSRAAAAFRLLAEYHRSGKILVASTRRLLDLFSGESGAAEFENWSRLKFPF